MLDPLGSFLYEHTEYAKLNIHLSIDCVLAILAITLARRTGELHAIAIKQMTRKFFVANPKVQYHHSTTCLAGVK